MLPPPSGFSATLPGAISVPCSNLHDARSGRLGAALAWPVGLATSRLAFQNTTGTSTNRSLSAVKITRPEFPAPCNGDVTILDVGESEGYPTDVIAGWLTGATVVLASWALCARLPARGRAASA